MAESNPVRWLCRRDMDDVLRIERQCFDHPWTREDFVCCLSQRNCIGVVVDVRSEVAGFMIYELAHGRFHILNIAVARPFRRMHLARSMVERVIWKLAETHRTHIFCEVRERNLTAQQFFKALDFRAVAVLRAHYDDTEEDAYLMRFTDDSRSLANPTNRIKGYVEQ